MFKINMLRRWFSFNKDVKYPRWVMLAVNVVLLAPIIWYVRLTNANFHYSLKQIAVSVILGYILLGFQIYGFIIVVKLILSFRKKIFISEENLELFRRLGIIMFVYVFAFYISSWINLFVNKEHLPENYTVVFFTNDNILYIVAGLAIYFAARYKQKSVMSSFNDLEIASEPAENAG